MTWQTSYDQWVAWLHEESPWHPCGPLDPLDEELCRRLEQAPFSGANEETVVSSNGATSQVQAFDSMATMVRSAPTSDESDEVTTTLPAPSRERPSSEVGRLEVALASPAPAPEPSPATGGQLEVELELPASADGLYIPALTRSGSTPPDGIVVTRGDTVIAPAPPPPNPPAAAPEHVSASEETPPEPMSLHATAEAVVASPASESGEFGADQSAASSQTAGVIVMFDGDDDEEPGAGRSTTGKIVVNTSLREAVIDEEEEDDEEDDEADELDASDLVEEAEPPPPPKAVDAPPVPPPARAGEPRATPRPEPPPSGEPSLATRAALAELQAETGGAKPPRGPRPWFEEVFDDHYAALTRPSLTETAAAEARFFVETARLAPGAHVLDMGCGQGAHALALAKLGLHVTGVDLSLAQLLRASQANDAAGTSVAFLQGDMRDPPVQGPFEGVLCVGSTLGYFSDEENLACLRRMHDMLTPGGKLLLEVFNRDHIISRLPARSWWQGRGGLVLDEAQMDYFANRLLVHRTVVFEDGRQFEHRIDMRAYAVHELVQMCGTVGLRVVEVSGSRCTHGRFFGATSPDIWLLAERPAP